MTAGDLEFLTTALARRESDREPLGRLAADPEELDRLLDSREIFHRLLEAPRLLQVSPWFFYYVVVRRAFLERGIEDRTAADYVGALLSYHLERRSRDGEPSDGGGWYLVDLIQAMAEARSPEEDFALKAEVGNLALYLAGVFPDWIYHRHTYGRRSVGLEYYEAMGARYYGAAARTELARRHDLERVLEFMAGEFPALRQALNDLVDEHLHLAPRPATVDALCRRALYRVRN